MLLSYSPSRCDPALLRRLTVGKSRQRLIETLVESVVAELGTGVHQHQLIVGPRGSGKTHVLTLVADRLESAPETGQRVLPLPLAEEEVVGHPADLVIKILERLEGRLVEGDGVAGRSQALAECRDVLDRLRSERDDDQALALAAGSLEEIAGILDRLLVPLVENLDSILFAGYARKQAVRTHWALRKILTESKGLMLLASAPSFFGDVTDEGAPFYGFFRTHKLDELPPAETLDLIRRRIEVELRAGSPDDATERRLRTLLADFGRRSAGLRGLLVVTGGLPRFAHLLFDLLVEADVESIVGMLERFLDAQTPYFQSRLDPRIVPQAELEILEILATADGPLLLGEITSAVRGAVPGNVSNYLKRLRRRGLVRQRGRRQEARYDLTEPLFRVWRRFRLGRSERQRIESLAELVAAVFEPPELAAEWHDLASLPEDSWRRQAVERALASAGPEPVQPEETRVTYGRIGDPSDELRRREAENERQRKDHEQVRRQARRPTRARRILSSVPDHTFKRFAELLRCAEEEGVRTGLIRFSVAALADPAQLYQWLPQLEAQLPASRRELLRPMRLAVEILTEGRDRGLSAEPEEMRRTVDELLQRARKAHSSGISEADFANEMIQALIEQPTAEALDALWALHVELEQQEKQSPRAIVTLSKALAACAHRADTWVRQAIRQADPATEPVDALAYLLTKLENGRRLWFELKEILIGKISEKRQRSIATCLEWFHDDQHIDWLEARVNRQDDFLGAAARQALFVLRPGRPPDPVADEFWKRRSYMAPVWWLLLHLNADSVEAVHLIAAKVATSEDPWEGAWPLSDSFENRIPEETLDRLLDATAMRLAEELAQPSEDGDRLRAPCSFLARIRSLSLIGRFEARRGTEFENNLVHWLCERGTYDEGIVTVRNLTGGGALGVLERIGGEGLTRVAHHYLRNDCGFWQLMEAIELAVVWPDGETADLLFEVAMSEEVKGQRDAVITYGDRPPLPVAQVAAVGALVTIRRLDLALRAAMIWGLDLSEKVAGLVAEHRPTEDDLKAVMEALRTPDGPDPGAVFALGLARREEDVPRVHEILRSSPKASELSRACLIALLQIGDRSPATIQAFLDHLAVPETEYPSWLGLLEIRTPEALDAALTALNDRLGDLERDELGSSAVLMARNLLKIEEVRSEVAEYLWSRLDRGLIMFVTLGELDAFAELDRQDVQEWIEDLAFEDYWMDFGARQGAIRALARRDPGRAFAAARLLTAPDAPHRPDAPALLLEIDTDRALPLLREWVEDEDSVLLVATVGEALHLAGELPAFLGWLEDPSPRLREGACIAAEVLPWSEPLAAVLRQRLYDEAWSVRVAANQALDRIWHAREIDRLVEAIVAEPDNTRRWCLLEVTLEGGHPGLAGPYRQQPWVARLFEHLPLAMRQRIVERLEQRRKKLRDDLKKRTRSA